MHDVTMQQLLRVIKLCVCGFINPYDGQIQLHDL